MSSVIKMDGVNDTVKALQKQSKRAREFDGSVIVGYTANYAIYVHENLTANHPVGQAKFLEQPARELSSSGELSRIIVTAFNAGTSLERALLMAGLRIQRESQKLVPVDTGNLKNSAFTRKDK